MRTSLPPATGSARWLGLDLVTGEPWLRIVSVLSSGRKVQTDYQVETRAGEYRLWWLDPRTFTLRFYRVDTTTLGGKVWTCNCPDATERPERRHACKHVRALRAALTRLPF